MSKTVIEEIAAERRRQIMSEGWDDLHDDLHVDGEMAAAAAAYTLHGTCWEPRVLPTAKALWPWAGAWWKPKTRRRDLIRAAALIVAEIERFDRAALKARKGNTHG